MGVLTVAFVADLTDVPQFEGGPEPHNDELKQLDPLQLAALGQLLFDGSIDERDPGSYGPTYDALLGEMHDRMHSYSDEEWAFSSSRAVDRCARRGSGRPGARARRDLGTNRRIRARPKGT
jgi:hypothetical protein